MPRKLPTALRSLAALLSLLQIAAPAGLLAQSADMTQQRSASQPEPQMSDVPTAAPEAAPEAVPVMAAPARSAQPLTRDEQYLQVLNRLTYGPRPGELERVKAMGLNAWLTQQLNPWQIDDSALDKRLAEYPAMKLPLLQLMEMYPDTGTIRAAANSRAAIPSGEGEKAIYNDQMARYKDKKKNGKDDKGMADDPAPLPYSPDEILAMDPAKRFSTLCKLTVPQLRLLQRRLDQDQRPQLTQGFTPRQVEQLAAFASPQGVVGAEAIQTKLLRDLYSERQLNEMMVDFWLNHFNVYIRKSQQAPYFITAYERDAIRPHAMGHFENLLIATATSPAMLNYLDNASSIGPHSSSVTHINDFNYRGFARPQQQKQAVGLNENYARELMELHTLGVNGGYTQHDVTEVAKVFTGWTVGKRRGTDEAIQAQFDPSKHEPGAKHVLGTTIKEDGANEGMRVLHMLATSPATAQFISTKLAVRFVADDPPPAMVDRMAKAFLASNGDIRMVLLTMVQSPEFFSRDTYRAKVKTPQEYVISAVRASGAQVVNTGAVAAVIAELGMPLYGHQTPDGYSMRADAWNNTAALVSRMNFALALSSNRVAGIQTDWTALLGPGQSTLTPEQKDLALESHILHMEVGPRTRQTILTQIETDPEQQQRNLRQISGKQANDPLSRVQLVPGRRNNPNSQNNLNAPEVADVQTALAAGLIFGSPEFQRR